MRVSCRMDRISNTFKYSRRHRRYFCFIIYWTIGVKIPGPARLLCVAVPRRKNWSRLYARFIKRRKKLYVRKVESFRWKYAREPVRNRESLRKLEFDEELVSRLHRLVRRTIPPFALASIVLSSLSAICTFNPRDIDPPTWLCHLGYYFRPI